MDLEFTWINLLILFGAFQGLIFGIILLVNKQHPGAKFLGFFMLIISYNGMETFSWSAGLDEHTMVFDILSFVFIFGLGPSLYLYIFSLVKPGLALTPRRIITSYTPLIIQFFIKVFMVIVFIYEVNAPGEADIPINILNIYNFFIWYSEPASVVVFWFFLVLSVAAFQGFKKENGAYRIPKHHRQVLIKWLRGLLICMAILAVLWPITLTAPALLDLPYDVHYYPIELLLVFFIYWIAFVGYHKVKLIHSKTVDETTKSISPKKAQEYLGALRRMMEEEKLYLDPELNRESLAQQLGINAKALSLVLNQYANQNFNDFVNTYRVREVTEKLTSPENQHLTITGMAFDSGFNSQATFQRVFKSLKGMSPKEFQRSVTIEHKN